MNEGRVPVSCPELPSPWWSEIVKRLLIALIPWLQAFDGTDRLIRGSLEIEGLLSGCCEVATKSRRQERHDLQRVRKLVDRLLKFVIHRPPCLAGCGMIPRQPRRLVHQLSGEGRLRVCARGRPAFAFLILLSGSGRSTGDDGSAASTPSRSSSRRMARRTNAATGRCSRLASRAKPAIRSGSMGYDLSGRLRLGAGDNVGLSLT